ncbi:MAG: AAA family ATPase [Bryobacterales bacterium]|nr:AAA family ATPase [Bryobacterales bacterium]
MKNKQRKDRESGQSTPNVKIDLSDFGPILNGSVELRPLTIFVGPSNAGKTYLATLIYSLHRILSGFRRPIGNTWISDYGFPRLSSEQMLSESDREQFWEFVEVLAKQEQDIKWSHLPTFISQVFTDQLTDNSLGLEYELLRCFDLTELTQLICSSSELNEAKISVDIQAHNRSHWTIDFNISPDDGLSTCVKIDDLILIPREKFMLHSVIWQLPEIRNHIDHPMMRNLRMLGLIMDDFAYAMNKGQRRFKDHSIHYLPAARSGIMQSYRIIASSLVSRSTGSVVDNLEEIPTFAGPLADFMERLLLFNHRTEGHGILQEIADLLEQETLGGKIIRRSGVSKVYPEFIYQPSHIESDIRLSRSSSMVSELAPIVLFLRGVFSLDSTVVIEEPEAHLHPAAQARLAYTLARMVRAGLKLVVTTHSDWLLKAISNLIREGLLRTHDNNIEDKKPQRTFLRRNEVGVWLFRNLDTGSSIEEIPFNTSDGVEPIEYEEVEEELYNEAAKLQNEIAEEQSE